MSDNDGRKKLRPKRFNKFETSEPKPPTESLPRRGTKRPTEDLPCPSKSKQRCFGSMHPPTSTPNLANNRLKKLKQNLQNDLEKSKTVPSNSIFKSTVGSDLIPTKNLPENLDSSSTPNKNIHPSSHKWTSPEPCSSRNYANNRLNRLKKVINESLNDGSPKFNDSFRTLNNSNLHTPDDSNKSCEKNNTSAHNKKDSPPHKNFRVQNLYPTSNEKSGKFVSNPQTPISLDFSPTSTTTIPIDEYFHKRPGFKNNFSGSELNTSTRILKIKKNTENVISADSFLSADSDGVDILLNSNKGVSPSSTIPKQTSFPLSMSENSPRKTNFQQKTSPVSRRLKLIRNNSVSLITSENLKNLNSSTFKEPSVDIPLQESLSSPNSMLPPESANNFEEKRAMTAAWIRNHQLITEDQSTVLPLLKTENDLNCSHNLSSCKSEIDIRNALDSSEEDMEWTNAEPDSPVFEIEKNADIKSDPLNFQEDNKQEKTKCKENFVCIVVDTNIFISDLTKLTDIINLKISGPVQPLLFIPWMVVTELDEIKDRERDNKLKHKAFSAIKFINKSLSEENPRVKGQTVVDMGNQKSIGASPDDKIIACCLQAIEKYETVILLSNDINLKNKAMINNIMASSANEIIIKIMSKLKKNTKTQKITQKVSMLCSEIICECAKDAYGDVWSKMDMLSNPPWSLVECLKRFKKYWVAVFREKLMKHFNPAVDKLLQLMSDNTNICDDSENYVEFIKLILNLCIFLKDIEEYRGSIENTINEITKIG